MLPNGVTLGNSIGIYCLMDIYGEPIYVGRTREKFATRIGKHLIKLRSDAVAHGVLDQNEVYEIRLYVIPKGTGDHARAEFTLSEDLIAQSRCRRLLNEKPIPKKPRIELPEPHRCVIIPAELFEAFSNIDTITAQRSESLAKINRTIADRNTKENHQLRESALEKLRRLLDISNGVYGKPKLW